MNSIMLCTLENETEFPLLLRAGWCTEPPGGAGAGEVGLDHGHGQCSGHDRWVPGLQHHVLAASLGKLPNSLSLVLLIYKRVTIIPAP